MIIGNNSISKLECKINLDGKAIFSKPLVLNEYVDAIRNLIKDRISSSFIFLDQDGNAIDKSDENGFKLEDIVKEKVIKLKSEGSNSNNPSETQGSNINVFEGNKKLCSVNCNNSMKLDQTRKAINNNIKDDFIFLDSEGNAIDKSDEKDFSIEDILINDVIKLKIKGKKKDKKNIDFSKFKIIKKRNDLTIYLYSELERVSNHPLVFQYFYDKFEGVDFQNAYVVLFCGKTGDGKTTAINGFFNIIKGITIEDDYRFILIKEIEKKKKTSRIPN